MIPQPDAWGAVPLPVVLNYSDADHALLGSFEARVAAVYVLTAVTGEQ